MEADKKGETGKNKQELVNTDRVRARGLPLLLSGVPGEIRIG